MPDRTKDHPPGSSGRPVGTPATVEPCYAHTSTLPDGTTNPDRSTWEPLFSPECPTVTGSGHCQLCQSLDHYHGHLNKVAYWSGRFAAEMFPEGSAESDAAREWGRVAGLWHDLGKFAPEWQTYLASKADPHVAEATGTPAKKEDPSTAGAKHPRPPPERLPPPNRPQTPRRRPRPRRILPVKARDKTSCVSHSAFV